MIHITYEGRFGNNLFQYCRGLCFCMQSNHGIANPIHSKIIKAVNPKNKDDESISQQGFFQDKETVDLFKSNKGYLFNSYPDIDGVFIHVRLGDIENLWSCSIKYYEQAIRSIDFTEGYISSDSPNSELILYLVKKYNLKQYNNTEEETIIFGSRFNNKILSLGTFSWWIGFLGNQKNVICPNPLDYKKWHGPIFEEMDWNFLSLNNSIT